MTGGVGDRTISSMKAVLGFIDRVLIGFATRTSGLLVALTVALLYGGCGLALPLALHWRVFALVEANAVSTVAAGAICFAWVIVQTDAADRRPVLDWTTLTYSVEVKVSGAARGSLTAVGASFASQSVNPERANSVAVVFTKV